MAFWTSSSGSRAARAALSSTKLHEIGVAGDDLAEPAARAQQQAEAPGNLGRLPERRHEQVAPVRSPDEGAQPDESLLGVG